MLSIFNGARDLSFGAVLIRMALSCLLGAVIGLERSAKNRPAGFRTHILVCMGAAIAAVTGLYLYLGLKLPSDVSRISAQVISGLGFIGAGTIIITKKMTIKGLTTAAGLWTTGIIGIAIGSGYYELAVIGTALVLAIENWFSLLTGNIRKNPEYVIEVHYNEKNSLDDVLRFCKDSRMSIINLRIRSQEEHQAEAKYVAEVKLRGSLESQPLVDRIQMMPGIVSAMTL